MNIAEAGNLLDEFRKVNAVQVTYRPTFMEVSGYPHYENVCSNILAFYLDPAMPHGFGSMCMDALLKLAGEEVTALSNVRIDREVTTQTENRIDLLISSDSHLIVIENKIYHVPNNPFDDYSNYAKSHAGGRRVVKILLALGAQDQADFSFVSYEELIREVRRDLGVYLRHTSDSRYLVYLLDFMDTVENLYKRPKMNAEWMNFVRERQNEIVGLLEQIANFKKILYQKASDLKEMIQPRPHLKQSLWGGENLYYACVNDILTEADQNYIGIDTWCSVGGWNIQIFPRAVTRISLPELREMVAELDIPVHAGERLDYAVKFPYDTSLETIRDHLQAIITKIYGAVHPDRSQAAPSEIGNGMESNASNALSPAPGLSAAPNGA